MRWILAAGRRLLKQQHPRQALSDLVELRKLRTYSSKTRLGEENVYKAAARSPAGTRSIRSCGRAKAAREPARPDTRPSKTGRHARRRAVSTPETRAGRRRPRRCPWATATSAGSRG